MSEVVEALSAARCGNVRGLDVSRLAIKCSDHGAARFDLRNLRVPKEACPRLQRLCCVVWVAPNELVLAASALPTQGRVSLRSKPGKRTALSESQVRELCNTLQTRASCVFELRMCYCRLRNADVALLASLWIENLCLRDNAVDDGGVGALVNALSQNGALRCLDVRCNRLSDAGKAALLAAAAVRGVSLLVRQPGGSTRSSSIFWATISGGFGKGIDKTLMMRAIQTTNKAQALRCPYRSELRPNTKPKSLAVCPGFTRTLRRAPAAAAPPSCSRCCETRAPWRAAPAPFGRAGAAR